MAAAAQKKIFYDICRHAERSPQTVDKAIQQDEENASNQRRLFSRFSLRGLKQLRIGWSSQREAPIENKGKSIVFSSTGEYIAILFQNQVTILSKDDNFTDACGTFAAFSESKAFLYGVWVDHWNILAVSDNLDTIYFLKPNGEELKRIPKSHLQAVGNIIGLFVWENQIMDITDRYHIMVITSDCILHHVEVSDRNIAVAPSMSKSVQQLKLRRLHPLDVACSCFHRDHSMLILAGPTKTTEKGYCDTGVYGLSIWRFTKTSDLELICFSSHLKGLVSIPKSKSGPFFAPKVIISSCMRHVVVLDLTGSLHVLTLEGNPLSDSENLSMQISDEGRNTAIQDGIRDIAWWSQGKLTIAKTDGALNVVEIPSFINILEDVPLFSLPVLGRNQCPEGNAFVLEAVFPHHSSAKLPRSPEREYNQDVGDRMEMSYSSHCEFAGGGLGWKLVSLLEQSTSEKYKILINGWKYEAALQFAIQHGLIKDEVFKSQWLHSDHGKEAIHNFLHIIEDRSWVLSECLDKVGSTVDSVRAILSYGLAETEVYKFEGKQKADGSISWKFRLARLRFLQYIDRLETFLGVNMGRFSSNDYAVFRRQPLNEIAMNLAESGKVGALNLLFKRHIYSLAPFILHILNAFPETIPVHNYGQLLPGLSSPTIIAACRDEDWVENQEMITSIAVGGQGQNEDIDLTMSTENMIKLHCGLVWPSAMEIIEWYKERARAIDKLSGQLENSLSLVDIGQNKGVVELRPLFEDISDLYHVVFSGIIITDRDLNLSLNTWEQLSNYEKFKIMLTGVSEATVVERLRELAIPFMHRKHGTKDKIVKGDSLKDQSVNLLSSSEHSETYLIRWLKEIAEDNQLEICTMVIEEGCKNTDVNRFFKDETEMIEVGLHCIYTCTHTDKWGLMSSLLSMLPRKGLRGKHSVVDYDGSRQVFRRNLGRALGRSSSSISSNSKLTMSPIILDEDDSSHSIIGKNYNVYEGEEKELDVFENLEKKLRLAEGHVEVGRLLSHYQVAKPIQFFLKCHEDEKGVKQLLRLLLSKFGRRQAGRSDSDWAIMWCDLQNFQEKAFPFLDMEYMLMEFCRGLLKAGKFSLARNYLKDIGSTGLVMDKADMLVIQAAREYFFSASSLDSSEIWKAKECLELLPNSQQVKAEADIIDAITVKLPRLGVTLLPMQFRQIRDPMEIVKMAIMSQTGAYLKVEELIEVARLLGLTSPDDIAVVEAAIAREAGATGDLQLAVDLCLDLVSKDHGPIWDLCVALGRGPDLDKMDLKSRKQLLGFALSHCDEESVGELLHAWKEIDLANHCEDLGKTLGRKVPTLSDQEAFISSFPIKNKKQIMDSMESSGQSYTVASKGGGHDEEEIFMTLKDALSNCTEKFNCNEEFDWDTLLQENKRFVSFAALQLPWLLELNKTSLVDPNRISNTSSPIFAKECSALHARAASAILYWLASNNAVPNDNLIVRIAKTVMEKPVLQESDFCGCSYLLNLLDPHFGVDVIEDALRTRKEYYEVHSAMKVGLLYSSLQGSAFENNNPKMLRQLLHSKFWESHLTGSECMDTKEDEETSFWKQWRLQIAEQQRQAQQARILEQMIPGVETSRFLSRDTEYIQTTVFSLIESVKIEKKSVLSKGLMLSNMYGVDRSEVLLRHLSCLLLSDVWTNEDIDAEISGHWNELLEHVAELLKVLWSTVYPALNASNKHRLTFFYKIVSSCYVHIQERYFTEHSSLTVEDAIRLANLKNELLDFIKTMITAGCSFRTIIHICFQGRPMIVSDTCLEPENYLGYQKSVHESEKRLTSSGSKDEDILKDIQEGYMNALDSAFWEIRHQISDSAVDCSRILSNVLSSLSASDYGDDEMNDYHPRQKDLVILEKIRRAIWSKLIAFADDLLLPNQVRVYLLEVLQCIAGKGYIHVSGAQHDTISRWHGWDAFQYLDNVNLSGKENQSTIHPLRSTLVALKSKELISTLWPDVEVNAEDLACVESSVFLFHTLATNAVSKQHILTLVSLLKEWECLFENAEQKSENKHVEDTKEIADEQDNWNEENEWDDGWETLEDIKVETDNKPNQAVSVHTYHMCWEMILEKLIEQCQLEYVLELLDEKCLNKSTILLTEEAAQKLTTKLATLQPAMALKCALLLPYDSLWFDSLTMIEDKLKHISLFDKNGQNSNINDSLYDDSNLDGLMDYGLLSLILSVGLLPSLAGNGKYVTVFSLMCALVGRLGRMLQESYLFMQRKGHQACYTNKNENECPDFSYVVLPYFIAELTRGKHYFLAGAMVFQFMHVHPALYSMDAVYVSLKRYLGMHIRVGEVKDHTAMGGVAIPHLLKYTVNSLRDKLPSVLSSAFSLLSDDL